jgi:hypothetical protein
VKKAKIKPPPNWEDTPQSFERFERLAKGLMAIPKKELDKELAKEARKKGLGKPDLRKAKT